MTPKEFEDLIAIAQAHRQRSEADLAKIRRQETQLRGLLSEMAAQFEDGVALGSSNMSAMHGLGAYQAWVDFTRRRRAKINGELSLVLAEKLQCMDALRRQAGRHEALVALQKEDALKRKRKREAQEEDKVLAAHMLHGLTVQRNDVATLTNAQRVQSRAQNINAR